MSFDDIASRMKDRRNLTRGEKLKAMWTGEEPELPPLPKPVVPAKRRSVKVAAYVVMFVGLAIAMAGVFGLVLLWGSTGGWEHRGFVMVIAIGISIVVKSTKMFEAVAATAPLPDARLR
ncbi:MAG: hypothetical protein JWO36_5521 [Myxococcales bacterium]|nr:hypothetical protein [Myxococcales bacterium]